MVLVLVRNCCVYLNIDGQYTCKELFWLNYSFMYSYYEYVQFALVFSPFTWCSDDGGSDLGFLFASISSLIDSERASERALSSKFRSVFTSVHYQCTIKTETDRSILPILIFSSSVTGKRLIDGFVIELRKRVVELV